MECIVEFDFFGENPDELTISKGDVITDVIVSHIEIDDGWYKGTLNGVTGLFPGTFVKLRERTEEDSSQRLFKAVYEYKSKQDDEISLEEGEIVEFLHEKEEGWYLCKLNGRIGTCPSSFLKEVENEDESSKVDLIPASAPPLEGEEFQQDPVNPGISTATTTISADEDFPFETKCSSCRKPCLYVFFECKLCPDFNLCPDCRHGGVHGHHAFSRKQVAQVHCDGCGVRVTQVYFHCRTCVAYDLCEGCKEEGYHSHHEFSRRNERGQQ